MLKILKDNKKYLIFIAIILLVGFLTGISYYLLLNEEIKLNISNTLVDYGNFKYNSIIKDLIIMSLLLVTSFFLIGAPLGIFYLLYETLSLGFLMSVFTHNFGISGLIYSIFYIIINELIVLILIIFFVKRLLNISRFIIGRFIYKDNISIKNKLLYNLNNSLYIIIFVLIINIVLYFVSPKIFTSLSFLLN